MLLPTIRPAVGALGTAAALVGCSTGHPGQPPADIMADLARHGASRTIEPRLSIPTIYAPCTHLDPTHGPVLQARCRAGSAGDGPSPPDLALAERAAAELRVDVAPAPLHAAALIDLLWSHDQTIPLERSISYLRTASRLADRPGPVLADLAAALLVRAERDQTPRDLLEAVDVADHAFRLEPRDPAGLFNLALGLDRLGLDEQAAGAWNDYLGLDSVSGWAAEARSKVQATGETLTRVPPAPGATQADVAAYASAAPQQARHFGWEQLLGDWGSAVLAQAAERAKAQLDLARALGQALGRSGDATLAGAVSAIDGSEPGRTRHLARAHRRYAAGRKLYRAAKYAAARRAFQEIIATRDASPELIGWARISLGSTLVFEGRYHAAAASVTPVIAGADERRQPALAGSARWVLGTTLLRRGRYEQAIQAVQPAAVLFERAGEMESRGAVYQLVADAQQYLGDPALEYLTMQRALTALRPYRRSVRLHNLLYSTAHVAAREGLLRAAARIEDEDVAVATRTSRPIYPAEARIARARLAMTAGNRSGAEADLATARTVIRGLDAGPERRWFEADLQLGEAAMVSSAQPRAAMATLDSVVEFFRSQHNVLRLLPALVARSEAALAAQDVPAAIADLERSFVLLDGQSAMVSTVELRASMLDAASQLVDRVVMLRVAQQAPAAALAEVERARVSLAPVGRVRVGRPVLSAPRGQLFLDYTLIGDTLLIWTVTDTSVRLSRSTIDRVRLGRTIERVRASLELKVTDVATRRDLAALFDWLIRPIEGSLGRNGAPVVVIADGEIAAVPFPALRDTTRERYLIEDHPLRFAPSIRDAGGTRQPPPAAALRALVVADPAFDARAFPRLTPLPGAAAEAGAIAALYPEHTILEGAGARRSALVEALRRNDIIHYAGHAVFDDARPERSELVLAPEAGARSLTAEEIERLDLRHIRLVVLSACETNRPGSGRSGGFAGLTGALLAAGSVGVLGTLWRVDDALTLQLMTEFHRAYRTSSDGPGALREAQLRLLHAPHAALRSPAAWAAFRYAGT